MRFIILIISFLAAQQLSAQNAPPPPEVEPKINDEPEIIDYREEMPYIKFEHCATEQTRREQEKCSQTELMKLIYAELKYPEEAKKMGIEGRVFIQFTVNTDGTASHFKLIKGIKGEDGLACDEEALRVVEMVCQRYSWIPGTQRGQAVRVKYNVPVKFKLN